jgi:hypothetical protein
LCCNMVNKPVETSEKSSQKLRVRLPVCAAELELHRDDP